MNTKYYYIMGLPASGKTTFLVAFTYMLQEYTEKVGFHLNPDDIQEGITEEFTKEIERWNNFKPLKHTGVGQIHKMKYILRDSAEEKYILEVPDRSGETFDALIKDRYIDDTIAEDWIRADEILFFVNFERMDIGDKENLLTELSPDMQDLLAEKDETKASENKSDDFSMFPGQFALVELLQMLHFIRKDIVNIKFIISAWDKVEAFANENKTMIPEDIFYKNLPFVYQFLNTNKEYFYVRYWGVSAQGSDLQDDNEIEQMSYAVEPMERVKVVDPQGAISYDLSKIFIE